MRDTARDLYDRFKSGGAAEIHRLVSESQEETLFLEFKVAQCPMRSDDRKNLAKGLSGFANANGGVIVWGVDCRREPQSGADVAVQTKPISNLRRFTSDLHSYTPQVTNPGIMGVEHCDIPDEGDPGTGYALSYVPESDGGPHMAIANREQYCYYCRIGGSFLRMEHYMVADRFHRRPQPKLEVCCRLLDSKPTLGAHKIAPGQVLMSVGIRNTGRGLAAYPALVLRCSEQYSLQSLFANEVQPLTRRTAVDAEGTRKYHFLGGADEVVYPGTAMDAGLLTINVAGLDREKSDLSIEYELYCDGFSHIGEATVPYTELSQKQQQIWHS